MCANDADNRFDGAIDLENAKRALFGRSVAFCKGSETVAFDGKGISPLMQAIKTDMIFKALRLRTQSSAKRRRCCFAR